MTRKKALIKLCISGLVSNCDYWIVCKILNTNSIFSSRKNCVVFSPAFSRPLKVIYVTGSCLLVDHTRFVDYLHNFLPEIIMHHVYFISNWYVQIIFNSLLKLSSAH